MRCSDSAIDLQAAIDSRLPLPDGFATKVGPIRDRRDSLLSGEAQDLKTTNQNRWQEYATGRALSHELMEDLGMPIEPVRRDDSRAPIWPAALCGSITHSGPLAVVMLARSSICRSLGIDLEQIDRVESRVSQKVLTASEQTACDRPLHLAVAFSAKEAGYKATYPLVRRYIGFQEAEVDIDWQRCRFSLRYVGQHRSCAVMEAAEGYFLIQDGHVLAIAIIPHVHERT